MAHITYELLITQIQRAKGYLHKRTVQNYQNYIKSRAKNSEGGYNAEEQGSGQISHYKSV